MLPEAIKPALQGILPAMVGTCSLQGVPNCAVISQVYWVDAGHVAISYQFFNKTARNIRENPRAFVTVTDPNNGAQWHLNLAYERSETEGPLFEQMEMQLEAIATMQGLSGVFHLKAADIYRVLSVSNQHSGPAD